MFDNVTHVIFDMDGLLLDTEGLYETIIREILGTYGREYSRELHADILGSTEQRIASLVVKQTGIQVEESAFLSLYRKSEQQAMQNVKLMPGAERLVRHLHSNGVPVAVATSSTQEGTAIKTTGHKELFALFHHIVCGGTDPEVKRSKPAPDIFRICAERFPDRPQPAQCLVFEDAPNGVTGALAAGMQAVMVPSKDLSRHLTTHATLVLDSLFDFNPSLFGLPPFPT